MQKMRKIIAVLLAIAMVCALSAGCTKKDKGDNTSGTTSVRKAEEKKRDLTEGSVEESENLGFEKRNLSNANVTVFIPYEPGDEVKKQIAAFEQRYGGKVTIESCLWDQRFTRLATLIQSGDAPDVVSVVYSDMPTMAIKSLIQPIDGHTDLNNSVYDQSSNDGIYSLKGKHYALTTRTVPYGIYYNESMFKRAGVKTPAEFYAEGTWNWENFRKTALAMSEDTDNDGVNDIFGFGTWKDDIFVVANGTDLIKMENGSPVLNINDPRVTEGLQFFEDMFYNDHSIQIAHWEWKEGFANKKVAMVFEGWTYQTQLLYEQSFDDEIGVVPFPMGPSAQGEQINYTANTGWGLCKDAANIEGGAAFIEEYLTAACKSTLNGVNMSHLTDKQFEMAKLMVSQKSVLPLATGYGDFFNRFVEITDQLRDGKAVGTILQRFAPELQNEINETLGFEE
ncbi:MAG: extracellular solute-binding protein [Clostridia bacterium]|nr:extracellular solute-binding protein [Clostridia bacterium]